MKKAHVIRLISATILAFGFFGCGDSTTTPSGPAFSTFDPPVTAAGLWLTFSDKPYVPKSLIGDHGDYMSGTADCSGGGKAIIEVSKVGVNVTINATYVKCVIDKFFPSTPVVEANGTYRAQGVLKDPDSESEEGSYSVQQQVTFSGEMGFAADCNYSSELTDSSLTYSGTCTYRDSEGAVLTITGDEMLEAFMDMISNAG